MSYHILIRNLGYSLRCNILGGLLKNYYIKDGCNLHKSGFILSLL